MASSSLATLAGLSEVAVAGTVPDVSASLREARGLMDDLGDR